jgi:hypothetical protein
MQKVTRQNSAACRFLAVLILEPGHGGIHSYNMSVHLRTTWHYIPEDGNIHKYYCEILKSYTYGVTLWLIFTFTAAGTFTPIC